MVSVVITDATGHHPSPITSGPSSLIVSEANFIREFTSHQRRLYLLILAQVPRPIEAEEILQNANVVLWKKREQFEEGTNFFAWAAQVCRFEILRTRRDQARSKLRFSDEFLEAVAAEVESRSEQLEARRHALATCLQKLGPKDRELIQQRYQPGMTGDAIAAQLGRPANSVYQSIGRIRRVLAECIEREVTTTTS